MRVRHPLINNKTHSIDIKLRIRWGWWLVFVLFVFVMIGAPDGVYRMDQLSSKTIHYKDIDVKVSGRSGTCYIYDTDGTTYTIPYRWGQQTRPGLHVEEFEQETEPGDSIQIFLNPQEGKNSIVQLEANGKIYFSLDDTNQLITTSIIGCNVVTAVLGIVLVSSLIIMFYHQNNNLWEYIRKERNRRR